MGKICDTCICRSMVGAYTGCEYALLEGHSRGCSVSDCDKYIKGEKRKLSNAPRWSGRGLQHG